MLSSKMMITCVAILTAILVEAQELPVPAFANTTGRRRVDVDLISKGSGPWTPGTLGMCEGDCRHDKDCAPGLRCYYRHLDANDVPPGCKLGADGIGPYEDYCVSEKVMNYLHGGPFPAGYLGLCEGDCDHDKDCKEGLRCWERDNADQVPPGCEGRKGTGGQVGPGDFCVQATLVNKGQVGPDPYPRTQGWTPQTFPTWGSQPLGHCEGNCENDLDCAPGLRCFKRKDHWKDSDDETFKKIMVPPGCLFGGKGDDRNVNYCVYKRPYHLAGNNFCAKNEEKVTNVRTKAWIPVKKQTVETRTDRSKVYFGGKAFPLTDDYYSSKKAYTRKTDKKCTMSRGENFRGTPPAENVKVTRPGSVYGCMEDCKNNEECEYYVWHNRQCDHRNNFQRSEVFAGAISGMCRGKANACLEVVIVEMGPNVYGGTKTMPDMDTAGLICPSRLTRDNTPSLYLSPSWGDEFEITTGNGEISAIRLDAAGHGWGLDLEFFCVKPCALPEPDRPESNYGVGASSPFSPDLKACSKAEKDDPSRDNPCWKQIEKKEECAQACDEERDCVAFQWFEPKEISDWTPDVLNTLQQADYLTRGPQVGGWSQCSLVLEEVDGHLKSTSAFNSNTECWVNTYEVPHRKCSHININLTKAWVDPEFLPPAPDTATAITVPVDNCKSTGTMPATVVIKKVEQATVQSSATYGFSKTWSETFSSSTTDTVSVSISGSFMDLGASIDGSTSTTTERGFMNSATESTLSTTAVAKVDASTLVITDSVAPGKKKEVNVMYTRTQTRLKWKGTATCHYTGSDETETAEISGFWKGPAVKAVVGDTEIWEVSCSGWFCNDSKDPHYPNWDKRTGNWIMAPRNGMTGCRYWSRLGYCRNEHWLDLHEILNKNCLRSCCTNDRDFADANPGKDGCTGCY